MKIDHQPVLKNEVVDFLKPKKPGSFVFVDCTLGAGGHTVALLRNFKIQNPNIKLRVIGIDSDENAIKIAKKKLSNYQDQIQFINDNFKNYSGILKNLRISSSKSVDAVLMDLGISSIQIDDKNRGFSFKNPKAKIDMRMNLDQKLSAFHVINKYSENELLGVFKDCGERFYKKIINNIIHFRSEKEIETVGDLLETISQSIPERFKHGKTHFATGVFRALRMEVNSELDNIKTAIPQVINSLKPGGRLAVITFHSTEDRLVKSIFNDLADPCKCPKKLPCVCDKKPVIKKIAKLKPGDKEISKNPRSRSAMLRVVEKI